MDGASVDVSPLDDIPQPWRDAMEAAGTYSLNQLASKAGAGTTTVADLIYGRTTSSERTMQAVADSLRVKVTTIREWAAKARGEEYPFVLPPEANRLTQKDRDAVLAVVRQLAAARATTTPTPDLDRVEGLRLAEELSTELHPTDTPRDRNGT